ncbi:MAG: putative bifunctional diguanylate cyclase/phosphodiesterase [Acidimicrobiales bacterium]
MDGGRLRELERAHWARLAHQATHDPLTGLANRGAFHDHLARALAGDGAVPRRMAVLLLDLDRFKEVNDTLGHHRGDALLSQVAHRLVVALGTRGFVARLGGDEFAAVVPAPPDGEEPEAAAARVSAALSAPFMVSGTAVEIGASIGIVRVPGHGEEVDLVLEHADAAMYQAKRGGLPYASYRLEDDQGGARRLVLAGELHGAMAGDELVLHYQPEVDLRTGRVVGVEALVRWDHPRLGLLPPAEFIPLAEATGQVRAITTWVLDHAAAQCVAWLGAGLDLPVSVNMSARDLTDADFPARVAVCLAQHRLPAHLLSLELTEGAPLVHGHLAVELVGALRALGVRVSLDDFGTGYSSLAHLESLPVDEIKIDRSLVVSGMASARSPVLRAIVALGRELGIAVVAEGVESANVAHRLLELGCNRAQGHHFAPSLPAADLEAWLRARQADLGVLGRRDAPWLARARGGRRAGDGATRPVARPPS